MPRRVVQISNELEFGLSATNASSVLRRTRKLDVAPEVNNRDCLELRVSKAPDLVSLNRRLKNDVESFANTVTSSGGKTYGGGVILADTSEVKPTVYRTTALSISAARGFMDIMSQQITMGINNEYLGIELYNFFRKISPALLAISASSPYGYNDKESISDLGFISSRITKYGPLLSHFPAGILEAPEIGNINRYNSRRRQISREVNESARNGLLDMDVQELAKLREYEPEKYDKWLNDILEPHQIYWFVRPRPDFKNEKSTFAFEIRTPDMPMSISRMQFMNQFVVGLAYYITENGSQSINIPTTGRYEELMEVSAHGLNAKFEDINFSETVSALMKLAEVGIRIQDFRKEADAFERNVASFESKGSDSEIIRSIVSRNKISAPAGLISELSEQLRN